jgi:xanthine/CO dehydrogenase XdhC/CoxF family maturation factor
MYGIAVTQTDGLHDISIWQRLLFFGRADQHLQNPAGSVLDRGGLGCIEKIRLFYIGSERTDRTTIALGIVDSGLVWTGVNAGGQRHALDLMGFDVSEKLLDRSHIFAQIAFFVRPLFDMRRWPPGFLDDADNRFPTFMSDGVRKLPAADMPRLATRAERQADHLIFTYSHDIDLALCDALLRRRVRSIGLIGSATKWARFRARLSDLGHAMDEIDRISCPIGDKSLGKAPEAIAAGVLSALGKV